MVNRQIQRKKRHERIRARMEKAGKIPRLCVFRSNKSIYAQIIDDSRGEVIANAVSKKDIKSAMLVGKNIAKEAVGKKIEKVVFDRGGYKYHGRIKALAEGAREGGLKF